MNLHLNYYSEKARDSWQHHKPKEEELLRVTNTDNNVLLKEVVIYEHRKELPYWCKHEAYARVKLNKNHPEYKSVKKELGN